MACGSRRSTAPPPPRDATTTIVAPPPPVSVDACTGEGNPLGVQMQPGFCMRVVATGLLKPRQMALGAHGEIFVAESGPGWRHHRGLVSVLIPDTGKTYRRTVLVHGLDRPHGIAYHDDHVWIAEAGRIARFRYPNLNAVTLETVVSGLPSNGRHPYKTLAFAPDDTLFFSVGSATDNCQLVGTQEAVDPCPERSSGGTAAERAVIMRWDAQRRRASVYARGLRNTLGMAWHLPSGRLWGVENSRDYINHADPRLSDALLPHDELNALIQSGDYGWPYCYDLGVSSPEYASHSQACRRTLRPMLLGPHSAPISILFYNGTMFPETYRGHALVTLHGYRSAGHRVALIRFNANGEPSGEIEDFIASWDERPGRPHGHLLGLVVGRDGSLFLSDDDSGAIYQILYGASALAAPPATITTPTVEDPAEVERRCTELAQHNDTLSMMQRTLIDTRCVSCHAMAAGSLTLRRCDARTTWQSLVHGRSNVYGPYVISGHIDQGVFMARLHGETMGPRMPMQGSTLTEEELSSAEAWVRAGAPSQ
jgi:glucose/arabinose dehydrogenase